jgi:hypothetical protein
VELRGTGGQNLDSAREQKGWEQDSEKDGNKEPARQLVRILLLKKNLVGRPFVARRELPAAFDIKNR